MTLIQTLLHLTNFKSPLLATLVPSVTAAYAIQTACALPSIALESEHFYDLSGSLTYLAVTALSLSLPALRAGAAAGAPTLLAALRSGASTLNWRQVALSGAVGLWTARLGTYLFTRVKRQGSDSRFDKIKKSPVRFWGAFMIQATWVSLCVLPVVAVNAVPAAAFAAGAGLKLTDVLGLGMYAGGLAFEVLADGQKSRWLGEKRERKHDEEFMTKGLFSWCRHPNYFGESMLWTGIATAAAGVLMAQPARAALGISPAAALAMCYVSPAFVTFLLLKVSGVPLSEKKYDAKYGDRKEYQEWKKNTPRFFPKLF
ncbi:hypothetical protein QBC39DRAFT_344345 [Podospora conica]|nr:hypothetical protein QBC39DRAFT_344345 [Schizothecium conicum]